jgi:coenzyme Q-binding protein COQ10
MPIHAERRVLPYRPDQLFALVADVARYPEFLPWCLAARVRSREGERLVADLIIGFKMVRERFTSYVTLDPKGRRIDVAYAEGPMKHLKNHWLFLDHPDGCEIDFYVDFEFRSKILRKIMGALFHEAVKRMVSAFEARAADLYGPPHQAGISTPAESSE